MLANDNATQGISVTGSTTTTGTLCARIYDVGKLTVNVAGVYSPEAKISGSNQDQAIASYTTKMSQFQIDVGGSYRF